jgi:hypothetical protein
MKEVNKDLALLGFERKGFTLHSNIQYTVTFDILYALVKNSVAEPEPKGAVFFWAKPEP